MVSSDNFASNLHAIYFSALKGSSYHSLRMGFLDWCHRWTMFLVILMSSSSLLYVAISVFGWFGLGVEQMELTAFFSLATLVVGSSDIAFSWTTQARRHDTLSNRWGDLVRRIDDKRSEEEGIREEDYKLFVKEHNLIIKDEPLIYMGLDAVAYNFVSISYGYSNILNIPWTVNLFKNWRKYSNHKFTSVEIIEPKAQSKKGK